jgi:hypothetical protein
MLLRPDPVPADRIQLPASYSRMDFDGRDICGLASFMALFFYGETARQVCSLFGPSH